MTAIVWKGEQRTLSDLAGAVESLCNAGQPILDPVFTCYQCDRTVSWLAPDSRCGNCTRCTPEQLQGLVKA